MNEAMAGPKVMRLFLIGYRACGKTSVARELAGRLQMPMVDTDAMVQELAGCTISQIFRDRGEAYFRDLESDAIQRVVSDATSMIVSLGGGAVLREENRRLIRDADGTVVWLDALPETLCARIEGDPVSATQRPAFTEQPLLQEIESVLKVRRPIYNEVSDLRIEVDAMSVPEIVDFILKYLDEKD